jgi:hypothetical protein
VYTVSYIHIFFLKKIKALKFDIFFENSNKGIQWARVLKRRTPCGRPTQSTEIQDGHLDVQLHSYLFAFCNMFHTSHKHQRFHLKSHTSALGNTHKKISWQLGTPTCRLAVLNIELTVVTEFWVENIKSVSTSCSKLQITICVILVPATKSLPNNKAPKVTLVASKLQIHC